ncbi:MAG: glycosyltransferase family 1 protein [Patescibacteria group bacterium]|jgi:glycosyltransferase involved in cell wall biosynthesis
MIIGVDIRPLMDKELSGVGLHLFNLLDELFRIDSQNQYKLFYNSFHSIENRLPKWDYPNVKFCGFALPNKLLNFLFLFFHWPKIDLMIGGCDAFVVPNLCYFSLSDRCKKISIVHDITFDLYQDFFQSKWRLAYRLINPKKVFTAMDRLVVVSQNTKKDLISFYKINPGKIGVVYSGVKRSDEKILENKGNFILTLGTREPRKNLAGLLIAYEKARQQGLNMDLVIAGGSGWLSREADRLIAVSNFKNNIKVLGYVSEKEKIDLYRQASMFVFPSFYEGFGFPPLEAMSHGCPVIASLSSSISEVCADAALLVDPYNINEIVEAIKSVSTLDSVTRQKLSARGFENIKRFSWSAAAQDFLNFLLTANR